MTSKLFQLITLIVDEMNVYLVPNNETVHHAFVVSHFIGLQNALGDFIST